MMCNQIMVSGVFMTRSPLSIGLVLVFVLGSLVAVPLMPVYAAPCDVSVRITTITIVNDADPLGAGEMYIESNVDSPAIGPVAVRIPPAGSVSMSSGDTWAVNTEIFHGSADSSVFPIALTVDIKITDEDPAPDADDVVGHSMDVFNPPCPFDQTFERHTAPDGESIIRFRVIVTAPAAVATDWGVLSVGVEPTIPHVGDPVIFKMAMTALSSTGPFPQTVAVQCQVDGGPCGSGPISFPGPTGTPFQVFTETPWPAALGTHTLIWSISTANDPNPANNQMSMSFTVQPVEVPFDFELQVSPNQQTAVPGGTAAFSINVNLVAGGTQNVLLALSGAPPGVNGAFNPSSGNPTYSSTLTLSVASSVSPGTYSMTITGTGGSKSHTAPITITISQAPDFQIQANPPSQTAGQGQTVTYSINISGLNGFSSQVSLSHSGLPAGVSGVFSTPSGAPNFASNFVISVPNNAPIGSFTIIVTGSGGGLTRVANLVLVITTTSQTQTSTSITSQTTQSPSAGNILDLLQRNSLIVMGILALLVLVLAAVALRRRKPAYPPPPPTPPKLCPTCGKSMTYVKQYGRWYCNNCKEYK